MTEHKTEMTITEKLNNNSITEHKTDILSTKKLNITEQKTGILNTKTEHDRTQNRHDHY